MAPVTQYANAYNSNGTNITGEFYISNEFFELFDIELFALN
jgi:hypothetical protein